LKHAHALLHGFVLQQSAAAGASLAVSMRAAAAAIVPKHCTAHAHTYYSAIGSLRFLMPEQCMDERACVQLSHTTKRAGVAKSRLEKTHDSYNQRIKPCPYGNSLQMRCLCTNATQFNQHPSKVPTTMQHKTMLLLDTSLPGR
jgi:hypothetical protein